MAVDHPCPGCGHSLVGHQIGSRCPECSLLVVPGAGVMRPRELFILGVRLIGVWYLIGSVDWIVGIIGVMRSTSTAGMAPMYQGVELYAINLVAYLAIGIYCLLGAPQLVGMTYGHRLARETAPPDAPT